MQRPQRPSTRVIGFAFFCLLATTFAWFGARWVENLPKRLLAATEAALEQRALELRAKFFAIAHFQPRVRVEERILSETTTAIAEIAVLEKNIEVQREFTHTWAGSTKTLRLRGKYRIKTGYNLLDRFEIQIEKQHRRLILPPASILSIEQTEMQVEALENGYWNPISADDLQTSLAALKAQAASQSSDLIRQTEAQFTDRLRLLWDPSAEIISIPPKP